MSEALASQYRYLIRRALKDGDPKLAKKLADWAKTRWTLDVDDALKYDKADKA